MDLRNYKILQYSDILFNFNFNHVLFKRYNKCLDSSFLINLRIFIPKKIKKLNNGKARIAVEYLL